MVSTSAIWCQEFYPLDVKIGVARHVVDKEDFNDGTTKNLTVLIPISDVAADGAVDVLLRVANPHRPSDISPASHDVHLLGLYVRSISWRAVPVR